MTDKNLILKATKVFNLRYGENQHQKSATLYSFDGDDDPLALHKFKRVYGPRPSFTTMTDVDRAVITMNRMGAGYYHSYNTSMNYTTIAVKHGNACGASHFYDWNSSIKKAISGDNQAVLGAVVVCNFMLDAESLNLLFRSQDPEGKKWGMLAAIACPQIDDQALQILKDRKSKCIVFTNFKLWPQQGALNMLPTKKLIRPVRSGFIVQDAPQFIPNLSAYVKKHGEDKCKDILLGWAICGSSNSNTITIIHDGKLIANATGQQKRVASAKLAVEKALFSTGNESILPDGCVAWSDSYFPYPDGVKVLSDAGVKTIFATSGSKRDEDVIRYCEENGVTFVTFPDTKARLFSNH